MFFLFLCVCLTTLICLYRCFAFYTHFIISLGSLQKEKNFLLEKQGTRFRIEQGMSYITVKWSHHYAIGTCDKGVEGTPSNVTLAQIAFFTSLPEEVLIYVYVVMCGWIKSAATHFIGENTCSRAILYQLPMSVISTSCETVYTTKSSYFHIPKSAKLSGFHSAITMRVIHKLLMSCP